MTRRCNRRGLALRRRIAVAGVATLLGVTMWVPAHAEPAPVPGVASPVIDAVTRRLSDQIGAAQRNAIVLTGRHDQLQIQREARATELRAVDGAVARLSIAHGEAVAELDAAQNRIRQLAVAAYKHRGAPRTVDLLLSASSARSFTFGAEMLRRADQAQYRAATEYRARRDAVARQLADAVTHQSDLRGDLADLDAQLSESVAGLARALATIRSSTSELGQHLPGVPNPGTTILGPSQLSARQLLDWYRSTGFVANVSVNLSELISEYLAEGAAEGVRGDIAFVQSIIETGYFSFPGGGQVAADDNNFAGIGACDSCTHGDRFADARMGVRAQIQLLRYYADPTMSQGRLAHAAAIRDLDHLGVKGCCPTWYTLTGTWATAPTYGPAILGLYQQVLDATRRQQ